MKKHLLFILLMIAGKVLLAQTILGIDVSHYQGTINWAQVSAAGKTFAYIKATEGVSYTDPSYSTYLTNGSSAGVIMGSYHFARPETNTAVNEANYYLSVAGSSIGTNRLPPALDLEDPPSGTALTSYFSSVALTAWAQTWMSTVQNATGIAPVIYTSPSIAAYLNSSLNGYKLWIANPGTSATTPPSNIGVWTTWAFKQYSWTGTVSGISGSVDLDVFNGTVTDFNNMIGTVPCTAPVNDNCPGTAITSNGTCLTGTVACATGSYGANQCAGCTCTSPDDRDVYYSFVAQATSHTVTLSNYASDFDAVMELRTACAYNTALGCYDPAGTPAMVSNTWNNLTIGNTYYIRIFEYNYSGSTPSSPTFDICVTHTGCTPPTAGITPSALTICSGSSTALTATGGGTYAWNTGAGTATVNVSPAGNTTYTVTVTSGGCTATASSTVTVNQSPAAGISPASVSICNDSSATLTATGGGSYSWSTGASSAAINVSPAANTTYTVTVTANTCSATASRTVNVVAIPTAAVSPSSVSVCSGTGTTLTATGGNNFIWSTGALTSSVTVSPGANTTYTVTVSNTGCNSSATAGSTVSVTQFPFVSINPNTASICLGGNGIPIYANGNAQNYSWSPATGLSATTGQTVTANPPNTTTYTVTASNGNCSVTVSATVIVSGQVTAVITPATPEICPDASVTLSATAGTAYTWSGPNGFTGTTQTVSASVAGAYAVTVTNPGGCSVSSSTTVMLIQNPAMLIDAGANTTIYVGDSALLGGNPTASGGTPPYTYLWSPATGLDNTGAANPYANPTGNSSYVLIATDLKGCTATDQVSVSVTPACAYVLDSSAMTVPADTAVYFMNLITGTGCAWGIAESCNWLSFVNTTGSGSSVLVFTVQQNTLSTPRSCTVTVQGATLVVTQSGAVPCMAPASDFNASQLSGFAPLTVSFTDASVNTPLQWEWTFPGGNPAGSVLQNPSVTYTGSGVYAVTLKTTNACGNNTLTIPNYINVLSTGIEGIELSNRISIHPNPSNGTFTLTAELKTGSAVHLKLFSILGQLVYSEQVLPLSARLEYWVSVSNLAAGVYLLQLTGDKKPLYQKVVIE